MWRNTVLTFRISLILICLFQKFHRIHEQEWSLHAGCSPCHCCTTSWPYEVKERGCIYSWIMGSTLDAKTHIPLVLLVWIREEIWPLNFRWTPKSADCYAYSGYLFNMSNWFENAEIGCKNTKFKTNYLCKNSHLKSYLLKHL